MSTEDRQQRRYVRASVQFPVTIIVPGHELVLAANAHDVSPGGMRVAASTDLPQGQSVVLRYSLPGVEHEMLMHGRVVLSFYDNATKAFAHGVAFTQIAPADRKRLEDFVATHAASEAR